MKKKLACDSIESLPDGGRIYHYLIDGVLNSFPVPPDGFDPIHASDQELETYGFPPRPDPDSDSYDSWLKLMEGYTGTPIPEPVLHYEVHDVQSSAANQSAISATAVSGSFSSNWSGYVSKIAAGSTFYTQAQASYTQPSFIYNKNLGGIQQVVCWVGIGGYKNEAAGGALVQAGTTVHAEAQSGGIGVTTDYFAWYEYLNNENLNEHAKLPLTVNPGDSIYVYISYQAANQKFNYYIANNTTGKSTAALVDVSKEYFDGSSVEWIVEKPNKSYFGKFSDLTLSNCQATKNTSNNWIDMGNLSGLYKVIMTETGLATAPVVCTPGEIKNNTDFGLTWTGYGKPTVMDQS